MSETKTETKTETKATKAAAETPTTKRVIVQRPYGVTDSHTWIGHNDFGTQVQFDAPVELPIAVVDHLKSCKRVEYRSDEKGNPIASYSAMFGVIDAPQ